MQSTSYTNDTHFRYKSAAYRLFFFRYEVTVPKIYLLTQLERDYGLADTGDDEFDASQMGQMSSGFITPAKLASIVYEGGSFSRLSDTDAKKIYNDIRIHLGDWLEYIGDAYSYIDCPINDLKALEMLAILLHTQVHYTYAKAHGTRSFQDRDQLVGSQRRRALEAIGVHRRTQTRLNFDVRPDELKEYVPIVEDIERKMMREGLGEFSSRSARGIGDIDG